MPASRPAKSRGYATRLAFLLGLIAPLFSPITPWIFIPFCLALLLIDWRYRRFFRNRKPARLWGRTFVGLLMGVVITGVASGLWQLQALPPECERVTVHQNASVIDFPSREQFASGQYRQSFIVQTTSAPEHPCGVARRVNVQYWHATPTIQLGDKVRLALRLRPVASQWNWGQIPDQARSIARGVVARGTAQRVEVLPTTMAKEPTLWRRILATHVADLPYSTRITGLMAALIVGASGEVSQDDWRQFRFLGLSHVLVISGLHIGLVYGLVRLVGGYMLALRPVSRHNDRRVIALVGLAAAALYALLAGLSIPTQRALLMITCLTLTTLTGWRTQPLWLLAFALLLIVALNPFAVFSSGLWLSVAATGVLLVLNERYKNRSLVLKLVLMQIGLTVLLTPLTVFWFGGTSVVAIVANILLVPIMAYWVIPLLLLAALVELTVAPSGLLLWHLAAQGLTLFLTAADQLLEYLPAIGFIDATLTVAQFFMVLCCAGLIAMARRPPMRLLISIGLVVVLGWPSANNNASLLVVDVGQGLAVLWQEADEWLLYDTGAGIDGGFTQFEKVVLPYLHSRHKKHLEQLVISHADADHSGGLQALKDTLTVGDHWGYGGSACRTGMRLPWRGESKITVLNGSGLDLHDSNDSSCVLMIDYRGERFVLAGDIGRARERDLVSFWREQLAADTLIVAHHGSQTSSSWTWLKWVRAQRAIISTGYANAFGHPHKAVIDRLQASGATVIDTARAGAVRWSVDEQGASKLSVVRTRWTPFWLKTP